MGQTTYVQIDAEADPSARRLAKALLIIEILAQAAACVMVLSMIDHTGDLAYRVRWHLDRWRRDLRTRYSLEAQVEQSLPVMLGQAKTIVWEARRRGRA